MSATVCVTRGMLARVLLVSGIVVAACAYMLFAKADYLREGFDCHKEKKYRNTCFMVGKMLSCRTDYRANTVCEPSEGNPSKSKCVRETIYDHVEGGGYMQRVDNAGLPVECRTDNTTTDR